MSSTFAKCTGNDFSDENSTNENDSCVGLIIHLTIDQNIRLYHHLSLIQNFDYLNNGCGILSTN